MSVPVLVRYADASQYRSHYERNYCHAVITTFDGIRVYFNACRFNHAFFESPNRDGRKNQFSTIRAERIDWIKATLENPDATRYQGWNSRKKTYEPHRRVEVVYENFVVVLQISKKRNGTLKANFITCYQADNSIGKIRNSPEWEYETCLNAI